MKTQIYLLEIIFFGATIFMMGCGDNNKSVAISSTTSSAPAPRIATVGPISSPPAWISKAHKDDAASCYLDAVNGVNLRPGGVSVSVEKDAPLVIVGWAFDRKKQGMQTEVAIELASSDRKQVYLLMGKRSPRPDVSNNENFRDLALEMPGLGVAADTKGMTAGAYGISIIMRRGDEEGIVCAIGKAWKIEL